MTLDVRLAEIAHGYLMTTARTLVDNARKAGFVVTIENKPLEPLAMGHYVPVVDIRPALVRDQPPAFDLEARCQEALDRLSTQLELSVARHKYEHSVFFGPTSPPEFIYRFIEESCFD